MAPWKIGWRARCRGFQQGQVEVGDGAAEQVVVQVEFFQVWQVEVGDAVVELVAKKVQGFPTGAG